MVQLNQALEWAEKFASRRLTTISAGGRTFETSEFPAGRRAWVIVETDTNAHAYQLACSSKLKRTVPKVGGAIRRKEAVWLSIMQSCSTAG
jgi:hypothetical protein